MRISTTTARASSSRPGPGNNPDGARMNTIGGSTAAARNIIGTILGDATIACETIDTNQANNRADASATVAEAGVSGVAGINVAISGSVNPAAVGQDLTYTITVTNPGNQAATGAAAHVTVPNTVLIVSMGGGSPTSSGVDFQVGSLQRG